MVPQKRRDGAGKRLVPYLLAPCLAAALGLAVSSAYAQQSPPPAKGSGSLEQSFTGLGVSGKEPIQFEAQSLEVDDANNMATFTGDVVARQNQTALKCRVLHVFYEGKAGSSGGQRIKRMEADQDVLVTSGDQTATGSHATFDTVTQIIIMTGDVVLTQGKNVIRGQRLVVDVNASTATMTGTGRVQMLVEPKSVDAKPTTAKPAPAKSGT